MKTKINNPKEILRYLKRNKIPFILRQTMFKKDIACKLGNFSFVTNDSNIKKSDLGFISLVKRFCEKNKSIKKVERQGIRYIFKSNKINNARLFKKDLYEIDLKGAYWNFAKREGYLSEDIYLRGLEVDKKVRLIALGNLAKKTAILDFDGENYKPVFFEHSTDTENVFFHVSQLTDNLMQRLLFLSRKSFLFYWVDAVIVNSLIDAEFICEYLDAENIEYKIIKLNTLIRFDNRITTTSDHHVDLRKNTDGTIKNLDGKRVFNFKKNDFINLTKKLNGKKSKKVSF